MTTETNTTHISAMLKDACSLTVLHCAGQLSDAVLSGDLVKIAEANDEFRAAAMELVADAEECEPFISAAREDYESDKIEIDDTPLTSRGEDGCFVAAWVFVSNVSAGVVEEQELADA